MTSEQHRQWLVARRPSGRPLEDPDFQLADAPARAPAEGEVRLRAGNF